MFVEPVSYEGSLPDGTTVMVGRISEPYPHQIREHYEELSRPERQILTPELPARTRRKRTQQRRRDRRLAAMARITVRLKTETFSGVIEVQPHPFRDETQQVVICRDDHAGKELKLIIDPAEADTGEQVEVRVAQVIYIDDELEVAVAEVVPIRND